MIVMVGASFETQGMWRKLEVSFDEADFAKSVDGFGVDPARVPNSLKYSVMSVSAQMLLDHRIHELGGYTDGEYSYASQQSKDSLNEIIPQLLKE